MVTKTGFGSRQARRWRRAFSLVELLMVVGIIALLAGLTLGAASGVMTHAARSRAASEIQAMNTGLESYKTDNGAYPVGNTTAISGSILLGPPSPGTYPVDPIIANSAAYQTASEALYQALSGQKYYADTPHSLGNTYMPFRANQVGNPSANLTYVKDPWTYPYGYSNGDANNPQAQYPYNGTHGYDIWTTGGTNGSKTTDAANWITNWK